MIFRYLSYAFISALVVCGLSDCAQAPDYPDEPVITYEGISKGELFQFATNIRDSVEVRFSFTDGDGDLTRLSDGEADVFLTDTRFPDNPTRLNFPDIEEEGTGNGISGEAFITIDNFAFQPCCIDFEREEACIPRADFPEDEIRYFIQVRDRAGNMSNVIETEPIRLLCLEP